jgi:hypothetical protein
MHEAADLKKSAAFCFSARKSDRASIWLKFDLLCPHCPPLALSNPGTAEEGQ